MRLLLLGDFSGRPTGERPPLATRPTHRVDNDSLDACMQRLGVGLPLGDAQLALQALDDFHPDNLHGRLPPLAAMPAAAPAPAVPSPAPAAGDGGRADLLAQLLAGGAVAAPTPAAAAPAGLDAWVRQIVAPHVVPGTTAGQAAVRAAAEADAGARLRAVLHAPAFQALEANWRGLHWLVSALELDEQLQVHVFDLSRDELLDDLVAAGGQVAQTRLFQALVQRARDQPDAAAWSALVGLWRFDSSVQHIGLLAALGQLAAQLGAPLLATADPALADDAGAGATGWQALRRSEVAPWIGLAAPGLLLRQPYGPRSDPVQALAFEEFDGGVPQPALCLWGSAALAPALLLARAFQADGWDLQPGGDAQIDGLPAVTWRQDGESQLLPVAWPALDEAAAQRLQRAGLMPLWAHRQQPLLRLVCWQSVAVDGQPLAGLPAR